MAGQGPAPDQEQHLTDVGQLVVMTDPYRRRFTVVGWNSRALEAATGPPPTRSEQLRLCLSPTSCAHRDTPHQVWSWMPTRLDQAAYPEALRP
jgi:hypothetical protein